MHHHFKSYYWKNGKPYGEGKTEDFSGFTYRIVIDPYHKRYSLEEYSQGQFARIIYDSALFDFRHLRQPEQASWQKVSWKDNMSLIRNHDDRIILMETYAFESDLCRECRLHLPQGLLLSTHKLFYTSLNDPFNGVILYDTNQKPVMKKTYEMDESAFGKLLSEEWDMQCPN